GVPMPRRQQNVLGRDLLEPYRIESENLADRFEIGEFVAMDEPIGRGDFEQRIENVFQRGRAVGEELAHLARIALKARNVLLGKRKEAVDMLVSARRNIHKPVKN